MARVFPCYTVLYCLVEGCEVDTPFSTAVSLFNHLAEAHQITFYDPDGVEPFLDQYLQRYHPGLTGPRVLGSETDEADLGIRQELHTKMLNTLLERHLIERTTVHKRPRGCLFCLEQAPNMRELFDHMYRVHRFNIGLLDNLIYADCFLNELDEMLKLKKQCIYCLEVFRNGTCLRKHLKSKNHYKIDSKDARWDKYYLVNYVNLSKNAASKASTAAANTTATTVEDDPDEDDTWDDLTDEIDMETQCLFCPDLLHDPETCFEHMQTEHSFDFYELQKRHELDYYASMKLLNYLRHCQSCDVNPFSPAEAPDLSFAIGQFARNQLPDLKLWNKPEFLFPVFEEDPLLTAIDVD